VAALVSRTSKTPDHNIRRFCVMAMVGTTVFADPQAGLGALRTFMRQFSINYP